MSMTVNKSEGVTVFTVTSNPKSKWPLFFQILANLCCSPVCFVSGSMKQQLGSSHTVLGALQIMVGASNMAFGGFLRGSSMWYSMLWDGCFWIGAVFIAAGIMCILVEKFPSPCLVCLSFLVNLVSFGLGITAIVFYSLDMYYLFMRNNCDFENRNTYYYYTTAPAPTTISPSEKVENCKRYKAMFQVLYGGMNIMMIVLCVLLLCLTASSCILSLKALCKKTKDNEEDPELQKPLVEDDFSKPAC